MRVLCIIPPSVPSYFNAGHHLPVFQLAAHLRTRVDLTVSVRDFGAANATWRDVCALLAPGFDVIALMNDFDAVDTIERFCLYARELCPTVKLITFGRASKQTPLFFERYCLDAIVWSGDYEPGVLGYLDYLTKGQKPVGVMLREDGYQRTPLGVFLEATEWVLPDPLEIPYEAYDRLYADDLSKFCGIPTRRELVVPVARGCPVNCAFCDVPTQQGKRERRLEVNVVVDYIKSARTKCPFDYVSFYAPTFTLKRRWVTELCARFVAEIPDLKWKCVTTLAHLDDELIGIMSNAGCVRISVGLETLTPAAMHALPTIKRSPKLILENVAAACRKSNVELNCFLMVGMPGDSIDEMRQTIEVLISEGHRIRPTVYTPYNDLHAGMTTDQFSQYNRQLLLQSAIRDDERLDAYRLLYMNQLDRPTRVGDGIPTK